MWRRGPLHCGVLKFPNPKAWDCLPWLKGLFPVDHSDLIGDGYSSKGSNRCACKVQGAETLAGVMAGRVTCCYSLQ